MSFYKRFQTETTNNTIVVSDSKIEVSSNSNLKHLSRTNSFLFLYAEDDIFFDIGIIIGDWPSELSESNYSASGNYVGINASSGLLTIHTLPSQPTSTISVEPGTYLAELYSECTEYSEYRNNLLGALGEEDLEHYEFVDKAGLYAWIPTILFIMSLLIPFTRPFWYISMLVMIICWLPFFLLTKTQRYKSINSRVDKYQNQYPSSIIHLTKQPCTDNIPGGYFAI